MMMMAVATEFELEAPRLQITTQKYPPGGNPCFEESSREYNNGQELENLNFSTIWNYM